MDAASRCMTELQIDLRGSWTPPESIFAARTPSGDKLASWEKCGNSRSTLPVRAHQISPPQRSTRARGREGRSGRHTWHHDGGGRAGNRPADRFQVHPSMGWGGEEVRCSCRLTPPSWSAGAPPPPLRCVLRPPGLLPITRLRRAEASSARTSIESETGETIETLSLGTRVKFFTAALPEARTVQMLLQQQRVS